MLSKMPVDLSKVNSKDLNNEILRTSLITALDTINLYEQLAAMTTNVSIRKVLLDVAGEEKEHVAAFQYLLLKGDKEQAEEVKKGKEEVLEIIGKKKK